MRVVAPTGRDWLARRRSMRPPRWPLLLLLVEMALGHHLVAVAAGARPAAPWRVDEHSRTLWSGTGWMNEHRTAADHQSRVSNCNSERAGIVLCANTRSELGCGTGISRLAGTHRGRTGMYAVCHVVCCTHPAVWARASCESVALPGESAPKKDRDGAREPESEAAQEQHILSSPSLPSMCAFVCPTVPLRLCGILNNGSIGRPQKRGQQPQRDAAREGTNGEGEQNRMPLMPASPRDVAPRSRRTPAGRQFSPAATENCNGRQLALRAVVPHPLVCSVHRGTLFHVLGDDVLHCSVCPSCRAVEACL
jgi:hypothetical protein